MPAHDELLLWNLAATDCVAKSWRAANEYGGVYLGVAQLCGLPALLHEAPVSWREWFHAHLAPLMARLLRLGPLRPPQTHGKPTLGVDLLGRGVQRVVPDAVGALLAFCMLYDDPVFERTDTTTEPGVKYGASSKYCVTVGDNSYLDREDGKGVALLSTPSFLYLGTTYMGGGDTDWWMYVVLSGTVHCPLAPKNYTFRPRVIKDGSKKHTFGPGSVVVFSLHSHGGAGTDANHIPFEWADGAEEEFGFACAYEDTVDEWVRVCVEEPVQASRDALPCGWPSLNAWLDDVELSFEEWREEMSGASRWHSVLSKAERVKYFTKVRGCRASSLSLGLMGDISRC